jgi:GT2 family glycosyltransferase
MVECQPASNAAPFFSVVIAVHNDGVALDACLHSLAQQTIGPSFEVIVVDDGSSDVTPESVPRPFGSVQWCSKNSMLAQPSAIVRL